MFLIAEASPSICSYPAPSAPPISLFLSWFASVVGYQTTQSVCCSWPNPTQDLLHSRLPQRICSSAKQLRQRAVSGLKWQRFPPQRFLSSPECCWVYPPINWTRIARLSWQAGSLQSLWQRSNQHHPRNCSCAIVCGQSPAVKEGWVSRLRCRIVAPSPWQGWNYSRSNLHGGLQEVRVYTHDKRELDLHCDRIDRIASAVPIIFRRRRRTNIWVLQSLWCIFLTAALLGERGPMWPILFVDHLGS